MEILAAMTDEMLDKACTQVCKDKCAYDWVSLFFGGLGLAFAGCALGACLTRMSARKYIDGIQDEQEAEVARLQQMLLDERRQHEEERRARERGVQKQPQPTFKTQSNLNAVPPTSQLPSPPQFSKRTGLDISIVLRDHLINNDCISQGACDGFLENLLQARVKSYAQISNFYWVAGELRITTTTGVRQHDLLFFHSHTGLAVSVEVKQIINLECSSSSNIQFKQWETMVKQVPLYAKLFSSIFDVIHCHQQNVLIDTVGVGFCVLGKAKLMVLVCVPKPLRKHNSMTCLPYELRADVGKIESGLMKKYKLSESEWIVVN